MNNNNKQHELIKLDLAKLGQDDTKKQTVNIRKYLNFFLRKKYIIIAITILISLIWMVLYTLFHERFVTYTTSVLIRFDDPRLSRNIGALTDFSAGIETSSKVAILKTNSFLGRVVDSLNLNLKIENPNIKRTRFIQHVQGIKTIEKGEYKLINQNDTLTVLYSNEDFGVKNRFILKQLIVPENVIKIQQDSMSISLNPLVLFKNKEVILKFIPKRAAINSLKNDIETQLDRSRTILTISYTHRDPNFSALVNNTIGNLFIRQLWDYERYQTVSILRSLEEQLNAAQVELQFAEGKLREFREKNPRVSLENDNAELISQVARNEVRLFNLRKNSQNLKDLIEKKNKASDSEIRYIYQEILMLLGDEELKGASVLLEDYKNILEEKSKLIEQNFSVKHPQVIEIENKLVELQNEIDARVSDHLNDMESSAQMTRRRINSSNYNLRKLPGTKLTLAELTRNHEIQENIVKSIMTRYNEAKVTDAAIIPDAYVIDSAEPPVIDKSLSSKFPMYSLGVLGGLIIGFAVVFLIGFFDPRLWISEEVEQKVSMPILATIPLIGRNNELIDFKSINAIDPKLVTADYSPTQAGEAFRRLRTVIEMLNKGKDGKSLLIGSLRPNEGKSLVSANLAITFAQKKYKTLLLDSDIRRGVLHSSFACKKYPGLTDVLTGSESIDKVNINKIVQSTHVPNLNLLSSGQPVPNPSELLGTARMQELHTALRNNFDIIIIDSSPFSLCTDLFIMNMIVRNILLVLRYQKTNLSDLIKYLAEFAESRADIKGIVINAFNEKIERKGSYQYSYYNY